MPQYLVSEQQKQFLKLEFSTRDLHSLETITGSPIQIVSLKGIKALKSIDDNNHKIRIVLVSLLVKIFLYWSEANRERLDRLKKIVYSSKLQAITENRGIVRQNLFKLVAEQLSAIYVGGDAEVDIIKMFNVCPFFDKVLIEALWEQNPLIFQSDCELNRWIQNQMDLRVMMTEQSLPEEGDDQLFLIGIGQTFHASKDCKCLSCNFKGYREYLRFSTQTTQQMSDQKLPKIHNRETRGEMFSRLIFEEQKLDSSITEVNPNLYASVLSSQGDLNKSSVGNSPLTARLNKKAKQIKQMQKEAGLFDSVNSHTFAKKRAEIDGGMDETENQGQMPKKLIKVRRSKRQNQQSTIWQILCCRFCTP